MEGTAMGRTNDGEAGRPIPRRLEQENDETETGGGKETLNVTLLGNTLPVPRWTLSWIGVLVLIAMAAVIARHLGLDFQNVSWSEEAKKQMEFANQEYGRHLWEEPVQTYSALDGVFMIKTYADHCIAIQRKVGASVKVKLIPDLIMESDRTERRSDSDATSSSWAGRTIDAIVPRLEAQGRCTTPHSGSFKTWNGEKRGCQVQVWRQWPDGCTHYQMMNTCTGAWDANADGSPRLTWTACRH
jgi:hypothetical protein